MRRLKLPHNHQRPEIRRRAYFCGDSLELIRYVSNMDENEYDEIVFAGVRFMAEMAAAQTNLPVYIHKAAKCSLAEFVSGDIINEN